MRVWGRLASPLIGRGFTYYIPPFMIRGEVVSGVMSFAEMENMMYKIEGEDRMPSRRAWASPRLEQEPTSKYFFWRGLQASPST